MDIILLFLLFKVNLLSEIFFSSCQHMITVSSVLAIIIHIGIHNYTCVGNYNVSVMPTLFGNITAQTFIKYCITQTLIEMMVRYSVQLLKLRIKF
jgi:uncharacterized membrane protein YuzA (DUF378 family)